MKDSLNIYFQNAIANTQVNKLLGLTLYTLTNLRYLLNLWIQDKSSNNTNLLHTVQNCSSHVKAKQMDAYLNIVLYFIVLPENWKCSFKIKYFELF